MSEPRDTEIVTSRLVEFPQANVFEAWTNPDLLAAWWGPKGFTNTFQTFDPRPGGDWKFVMHGPDGTDYPNHSRFVEVVADERIVFDHLSDHRFRVVATFAPEAGKTRVTFRMQFDSKEECDRVKAFAVEKNEENLDRLEALLTTHAGDLVITRIFDAPRSLVWKAWSEAAHLSCWWGPKDFASPVWTIDFRVGGRYHYCMRSPEGHEYWGTGIYHEIVPLERIVYSDSFADAAGNVVAASAYGLEGNWPLEMLVTVTLDDMPGGTRLTLRHRGMPAGSGKEQTGGGWCESFDKLAMYLMPDNLTKF